MGRDAASFVAVSRCRKRKPTAPIPKRRRARAHMLKVSAARAYTALGSMATRKTMHVVKTDIWLCEDCTVYACNGDLSGIDYYLNGPEADARAKAVERGVARFGPHLVSDFDSETSDGIDEFARTPCAACRDKAHGPRHRFAVLGR